MQTQIKVGDPNYKPPNMRNMPDNRGTDNNEYLFYLSFFFQFHYVF